MRQMAYDFMSLRFKEEMAEEEKNLKDSCLSRMMSRYGMAQHDNVWR